MAKTGKGNARTGHTVTPARIFRVRFEYDTDHSMENPSGSPLPGPESEYVGNEIMQLIDPTDDPIKGKRRPLSYAEYCQYYGNRDRHISLGAILEEKCSQCGSWHDAPGMSSLWGIDFMDDNPEAQYAGDTVKMEDFGKLPGHLAEVVQDLMSEAGVKRGKA